MYLLYHYNSQYHDNSLHNSNANYHDMIHSSFILNLSILIWLNDEYHGSLAYLPMMGLAPISPLSGALPWATTARVDMAFGAAFVVAAAAEAIDIATAAVYGNVYDDGYDCEYGYDDGYGGG